MSDQADQTPQTQPQPAKPPVIMHNDGAVFAKVWENVSDKGGVYFNVTSGKFYTDPKTGKTQVSQNLKKSDLPKMQFVMGEAYRSISLLQQNIRLEDNPEPEKRDWLAEPNAKASPSNTLQNDPSPQIENGRAQSPEM